MKFLKNRLEDSTSLYLQQHKANPVAWQPWEAEVLAQARRQDKPLLLSIGYSACHWCHVMADESFEDPEVAELMNSMFVSIKVDREERPDIDHVYQAAHQMLTGRPGGWPLTVFMCPRTQLPFLVGTYFPKEGQNGQLSFRELLLKVNDYYGGRGKDFLETLDEVKSSYKTLVEKESKLDTDIILDLKPCNQAVLSMLRSADVVSGGFGGAPKFPMPNNLERLYIASMSANRWQQQASEHLQNTLLTMSRAGIMDQIGGGFFRYSTDDKWMIPHFEKMLYDNGQLLSVYAESYQLFKLPQIKDTVKSLAQWALTFMRNEDGVFYASLDADSENREGRVYLWSKQQLNTLLTKEEVAFIFAYFDLDKYPNFEGSWHLHRERRFDEIVHELEIDESHGRDLFESVKSKLSAARNKRVPPTLDNKIITAWNGLTIKGFAIAARTLQNDEYLRVAQKAIDFTRNNLVINGRLYSTWQNGEPKISGYLDDYVFLMDALLEMMRVQWRDEDYRFLCNLAEVALEHFEDTENGGFYFSADDAEHLIYRSKPAFDNVMPSGNGVAAKVFGRLGHLCAEPRYLEASHRTLLNHWPSIFKQPQGHHQLLVALQEYMQPPELVLLKGRDSESWRQKIQEQYGDAVHCYLVPEESEVHPPEAFALENGEGIVCTGDNCFEMRSSMEDLMAQIDQSFKLKSER